MVLFVRMLSLEKRSFSSPGLRVVFGSFVDTKEHIKVALPPFVDTKERKRVALPPFVDAKERIQTKKKEYNHRIVLYIYYNRYRIIF